MPSGKKNIYGTPSGRAPVKMPKPVQVPVQVIRTTVAMKPTPTKKK